MTCTEIKIINVILTSITLVISVMLFENQPKCLIWIMVFWHFPPIFVLLKVTCLVTLFDRKHQVFKNSPNLPLFCIFNELLSTQNVNVACFAWQYWIRLFLWFPNTVPVLISNLLVVLSFIGRLEKYVSNFFVLQPPSKDLRTSK